MSLLSAEAVDNALVCNDLIRIAIFSDYINLKYERYIFLMLE